MIAYWISYKVINVIPAIAVSTFIVIKLTYQTIYMFISSIKNINRKSNIFCELCYINDKYENIYCHTDILYVLDLFHNPIHYKTHGSTIGKDVRVFNKIFNNISNNKVIDDKTNLVNDSEPEVEPKKSFFQKHIYEWNDNFKFTSRFINSHVVAFLALFHFSMYLLYKLVYFALFLKRNPNYIDLGYLSTFSMGDVTCAFGETYCLTDFKWPLPIPNTYHDHSFVPSTDALLIVPFFLALVICTIQLIIGIRNTKKNLLEIYKGTCESLPPRNSLTNKKIAGKSFNYGGYLTGYLIWGFVIQYFSIFLLGLLIILLRLSQGADFFLHAFYKILVFGVIIVFEKIVYLITTRIFLKKGTKVLALDNYRAFNIFLFFIFFFNCFVLGIIIAIIRLIKGGIAAVLWMPRIDYSVFGRLLDKNDSAFLTYTGYLYIEAGKNNVFFFSKCLELIYFNF